jgi:hypothetical protein
MESVAKMLTDGNITPGVLIALAVLSIKWLAEYIRSLTDNHANEIKSLTRTHAVETKDLNEKYLSLLIELSSVHRKEIREVIDLQIAQQEKLTLVLTEIKTAIRGLCNEHCSAAAHTP